MTTTPVPVTMPESQPTGLPGSTAGAIPSRISYCLRARLLRDRRGLFGERQKAFGNNTFVPLGRALDAVTRLRLIIRLWHDPANLIIASNGSGAGWRKMD